MYSYAEAVTLFKRSIELADASQGENLAWVTTFVNLGTALRQVGYVSSVVLYIYPSDTPCYQRSRGSPKRIP